METILELLLGESPYPLSPYGIWSSLHMNMEAEAAVGKHKIAKKAVSIFFFHVCPTRHSNSVQFHSPHQQ